METTIAECIDNFRKTVEEQYDKCYNEGINSLIATPYPITDKYVCAINRDENTKQICLELFFDKNEDPSLRYYLDFTPDDKPEAKNITRDVIIKAMMIWIATNEKQGEAHGTSLF